MRRNFAQLAVISQFFAIATRHAPRFPCAYIYARRRIYGWASGYGVARRIVARCRDAQVFAVWHHDVRGDLPGNTTQHVFGRLRSYFWRGPVFFCFAFGPLLFACFFRRMLNLGQSHNKAYIPQQDGASSHTANDVQDWRSGNFYAFWPKGDWPPNIPDLNPLGFFVRGLHYARLSPPAP